MSAADILSDCGFASAEEVAEVAARHSRQAAPQPRREYDLRGVRYVRTLRSAANLQPSNLQPSTTDKE